MNFLAHLYLSGDSPELMVGNFIGDFVRGKQVESFDKKVKQGILLHRAIDEFTDSHQIVSASKSRLWGRYRHYSGVIVDIFYDHFLAKNWDQYNTLSLERYAAESYQTLQDFGDVLPQKVHYILPHMIEHNWLVSYASIEGIYQVMQGMSRRATFDSKMEHATQDLEEHYAAFEKEFTDFFPQLIEHSKSFW
ncbi:MAG: acyl carrier protein phosphodiesterase [Bacteroidota bacterium]